MKAFVIGRPYHLFNAINFVITNGNKGDAFILNEYSNARKDYIAVKEAGIFQTVYFVEESSLRPRNRFFEIIYAFERGIQPTKIIKKSVQEPKITIDAIKKYSEVYSATPGSFVLSLLKVSKAKYYVIEDGAGTYAGKHFLANQSIKHRLYCAVFKSGALNLRVEGVYVYRPEICRTEISDNILKLPTISPDRSDLMQAYQQVFNLQNDNYKANFIFLSQRLLGLNIKMDLAGFVETIFEESGIDDYCYRLHPAEVDSSLECRDRYSLPSEMWELLCLNYINDNKVLLTINSSAAFSPFKLYNIEPHVVFLYKVVGLQGEGLAVSEDIVASLKRAYSDQTKVHVPNNKKELISILIDLRKKLSDDK